jgi:hypothetical protein
MGTNYLAGRPGDAAAVLAAAGYNFRRLIAWLKLLLCPICELSRLQFYGASAVRFCLPPLASRADSEGLARVEARAVHSD